MRSPLCQRRLVPALSMALDTVSRTGEVRVVRPDTVFDVACIIVHRGLPCTRMTPTGHYCAMIHPPEAAIATLSTEVYLWADYLAG